MRAGLEEPKHAFEVWAKDVKEHRDAPGHKVQSVEESSFDAWIRLYRPDENSPNVSESYYRRGALIGLALDLTIRSATKGRRSLDDVVLALWRRWGARGKPYPDGAWEAEATRIGGVIVKDFFDRYVRGVGTPPFEILFPAAGLIFREKPEKEDGNGGDESTVRTRADFGWKTKVEGGKLLVAEVYDGRAASLAGVSAADEIVAVDGVKADEDQLKRIARDVPPGQTVRVHLFRLGRLLELALLLGARRAYTYEIVANQAAPDQARRLFTAWLGSPFPKS